MTNNTGLGRKRGLKVKGKFYKIIFQQLINFKEKMGDEIIDLKMETL